MILFQVLAQVITAFVYGLRTGASRERTRARGPSKSSPWEVLRLFLHFEFVDLSEVLLKSVRTDEDNRGGAI
jgi:hypothetical protein